jgi:hypothetical protein
MDHGWPIILEWEWEWRESLEFWRPGLGLGTENTKALEIADWAKGEEGTRYGVRYSLLHCPLPCAACDGRRDEGTGGAVLHYYVRTCGPERPIESQRVPDRAREGADIAESATRGGYGKRNMGVAQR